MRQSVRDVAKGRWSNILFTFGLTDKQLSGKHTSCPICVGKDRFRFDNKEGRGTFYCSHCGAGDGVNLVMLLKEIDFKTAAAEIEQIAGVVNVSPTKSPPDVNAAVEKLKRVWGESDLLVHGNEGMRYLAGRGLDLDTPPKSLRLHPDLAYYGDGGQFIGKFPALVALVTGPEGKPATLHRTYLQDAIKATVPSPKKLMSGKPIAGGAIRLSDTGVCLGIAEGIETALAASALFQKPVWSCVNAHGIETFVPPANVERITIYSDNDGNFVGQKAAFTAAHRLRQQGFEVAVMIPPLVGDWLDVLNGRTEA
jgi:putative DNA primase/helicase